MDVHEPNASPAAIALRRRWYVVIIVALIAVAVSIAFSRNRTVSYSSSAEVLVDPVVSADGQAVDADEIATQAQVVTSLPIAREVVANLGLRKSPDNLLDDVSVSTDNTRVITISATNPEATEAAAVANGFAKAYVSFRQDQAAQVFDSQRESLSQQLTNLQRADEKIKKQLDNASGSEAATLEAERNSVRLQVGQVLSELASLNDSADAADAVDTATILMRAAPSSQEAGPDPVRTAILVGILGLVAGGGLALLLEQWSNASRAARVEGEDRRTKVAVRQ